MQPETLNPPSFPSLSDLESEAARKVNPRVWAYIQGGAGEERTLRANREAFARRVLRPRVLVDVSTIRIDTHLLGQAVSAPFYVSPMAYQREIHPSGELAVAQATAAKGILAVYSTLSSLSLEDIAQGAPQGRRWFQLYLQPSRESDQRLIERAARSGYSALVVTVDTPILGVRDTQARAGFAIDGSVPIGNGADVAPPSRTATFDGEAYRLRRDTSATWEALEELSRTSPLPVVVKGVLTAEDAHKALDHGAKAVLVSNHGGRQLDGVPASLDVLAEVVGAVGTEAEVYLDGGVRRGSDILMALALGARAVGIGRPILWSLAVGGPEGVARYLDLLKNELVNTMALAGRRSIAEVDRTLVG